MASTSNSTSSFTREACIAAVQAARAQGLQIIFTSGAFDLVHPGHVQYLAEAKALGGFLVVGVNSDTSVQQYKDPRRPIASELERAAVIAALRCVDAVFIFDELNNQQNIELLKPDVYVKAGDYSKEKLSSASLVEKYGGRVELVHFEPGHSTSQLVERVLNRYAPPATQLTSLATPALNSTKAVFLDRDGTINQFVEYLGEPEKFEFIPGAVEGLKLLKDAGFKLIITTNQPGIGLGYFTVEDFYRVTRAMFKGCDAQGVSIDRVYFSPERATDSSEYRKPAPGMIRRAQKEDGVDISKSFVIGDMTIDLEFARQAGCRSILVQTGHAGADKRFETKPDFVAKDLLAAAKLITSLPS